ncbi:MAG: T9SS C-terminal target domain-containing protein, partial [Sphingobacteriia bacterium]|nr:T9SS C-terminal target domain-containing protein [Sphingobacteriia bacterium]
QTLPVAPNSVAFGQNTNAAGAQSLSGGSNFTIAAGNNSIAFGDNVQTLPVAPNSVAFGQNTEARGAQSLSGGSNFTIAAGNNSIAFGDSVQTLATAPNSVAFGIETRSTADATFSANRRSQANGTFSCAFNNTTLANGASSCAFGGGTLAGGNNSASFGHTTQAIGDQSFVAGYNSRAHGRQSAAFGMGCQAGSTTSPLPEDDFACGRGTIAEGGASFTTGISTHATGGSSVAMGSTTWASAVNSFAMGDSTTAAGDNAIASGNRTHANALNSQAHGFNVVNNGTNSFAQGQQVLSNASNNVTFGSGGPSWLVNTQTNSFMAGFNSDVPTFFVSSAMAPGTTGNVGIGGSGYSALTTPNPLEKLEVWNGNIRQMSLDLFVNPTANSSNTGYNNLGLGVGLCPFYGLTTDNNSTLTNPVPGIANTFLQMGIDGTNSVINFEDGTSLNFNATVGPLCANPYNSVISLQGPASGGHSLTVSGTAWSLGWFSPSDQRFKNSVQTLDKPIDLVKRLRAVSYNFNRDLVTSKGFPSGKVGGFIAQELINVIPEAVKLDKEGYYGVNYDAIVPYLTGAIQDQQVLIEALQNNDELVQTKNENDILNDSILLAEQSAMMNEVKGIKAQLLSHQENENQLTTQVKAQQVQIEKQQEIINQQNEALQNILIELTSLKSCVKKATGCDPDQQSTPKKNPTGFNLNSDVPSLGQNFPNPFGQFTSIPYYLPLSTGTASLIIYNLEGILIQQFDNLAKGNQKVDFAMGTLSAGTYFYKLVVDGKVIDALKMTTNKSK